MAAAKRYLLYASEVYALPILRPLQAAIRARGGECAWFFDGPGSAMLEHSERRLSRVADVLDFRPSAVLVPGNMVPDFFPGAKVEVFHGFSVGKRSEERGHFRIRGFFDLYCTQGSTTTRRFEQLSRRHGHFRVIETGWPKMDPLFRPPSEPNPWCEGWQQPDLPTILFASTFTPSLSAAAALHPTVRDEARRGRWNWLVTLHPKMSREVVEAYRALEGPHLRFAAVADTVPLLQAADVLLSDTSSIVFEFLLQQRPAVTFRNTRPGPHLLDVRDVGDVVPALTRALGRPPATIEAITRFADSIHPYRDGRSAERVLGAVDRLLADGLDGLGPKPLNLWRRLQMRRQLGYYRWG
jgi:CDP-glycerol glycerophosphotransferase (TagB/SpsB family)